MPAAGSRWPVLALTPAIVKPCGAAWQTAPSSVGSPSGVPVPWASRTPAVREARPYVLRSSCSCAEPLGAVRLALRPSCCVPMLAKVATQPGISSAGVVLSTEGWSTRAPTPSART
eukprot:6524954-Prymnesium_polylepis.3